MDFYFVYSSGGGAGDWNGVDRMFSEHMPNYLKDHLLIKFGDIFFNHRSQKSIIKPKLWNKIDNARDWIIGNTNDEYVRTTTNLVMDVGTTKIVSYLSAKKMASNANSLVDGFKSVLYQNEVLKKYCDMITMSNINYAVTFDIPNLFKVRSQVGDVARRIVDGSSNLIIDSSASFANDICSGIDSPSRLLTTINGNWSNCEIESFLSKLNYIPTKLGIGGLSDERDQKAFSEQIARIDELLGLHNYERVHFLGCGGLKKANIIKNVLGNCENFSVDNTTAYNRSIDGSTSGETQSCYYDYVSKEMIRISPQSRERILHLHLQATNLGIAHFGIDEMSCIIDNIIMHQSYNSSQDTYNARGMLIMHNFDVFRFNAK